MNVFEFARKIEKLDEPMIIKAMIEAVHVNSDIVIQDAIASNFEGQTFAGNPIKEYPPFSDWFDTGEFHDNLKFANKNDIEFSSRGEGMEVIFEVFPENDTIAPTAKILSGGAIKDIKASFIKIIEL